VAVSDYRLATRAGASVITSETVEMDEEGQPEPELGSRSLCCPKQRSHAASEKDVAVPPRP
jgi:hypothetical protein